MSDYLGKIALEGRHNKFLVDRYFVEDGVEIVEGPSIRRDGELAKTVRRASFPFMCTFQNPEESREKK